MFCPQCGAQVEKNQRFCKSCGTNLAPGAPVPSQTDSSTPPTSQKRRMPLWFKIIALVAILALIGVSAGLLFTESLVDVVDHQLSALRKNDLSQAYYAYTSKDFQETTSPEQFQEFIEAYPIFSHNQSTRFTQRSIENRIGTLKGQLLGMDHTSVPVEYKLIKEDGKWKILSIRLLQPSIGASAENVEEQELTKIIKSQLQLIKAGKVSSAYDAYSSKKFKEATTQESFQQFIQKYPIFSNYHSISFHHPVVSQDGIQSVASILQSAKETVYIKYYLIPEDHSWKIVSMRILSPTADENDEAATHASTTPETLSPMQFSNIKLGDKVDEKGIISDPATVFKDPSKDIYINLDVLHGIPEETVSLELHHVESGTSIPAKAVVSEKGESTLFSSFTPPAEGWPKGHYKLILTTSKGLSKIVDFEMD